MDLGAVDESDMPAFTSIEIVPFIRIWQCQAIYASAWVHPNLLTAFLINAIARVARPGRRACPRRCDAQCHRTTVVRTEVRWRSGGLSRRRSHSSTMSLIRIERGNFEKNILALITVERELIEGAPR
jgi:hypothetical protein